MSNHLNKHSSLAAQSLQQLKRDIILIPLGYPWTLSPPVFFFVNSSSSLLFWSYTLVPAFGWNYLPHEKGEESEAQSFLFFWKTGGNGAPYSHENLLGCGLQSDVLELASLFSQIPQWYIYILVVQNQFQFPLRSLPLVCWNERATLVVNK